MTRKVGSTLGAQRRLLLSLQRVSGAWAADQGVTLGHADQLDGYNRVALLRRALRADMLHNGGRVLSDRGAMCLVAGWVPQHSGAGDHCDPVLPPKLAARWPHTNALLASWF